MIKVVLLIKPIKCENQLVKEIDEYKNRNEKESTNQLECSFQDFKVNWSFFCLTFIVIVIKKFA